MQTEQQLDMNAAMTINNGQALNPARPGPLALKPSRPGLKSGPARKMWEAGDGWSKATGVGYYVIMSSCAVAVSMHKAIQLPR